MRLAPLIKTGQIKKMIMSYVGTNKTLRRHISLGKSPRAFSAGHDRRAATSCRRSMPGFFTGPERVP